MPTQQHLDFGFPIRPMMKLADAMRLVEDLGVFHEPLGYKFFYSLCDAGDLEAVQIHRIHFIYTDSLVKWILSLQPEEVRAEWEPRIEQIVYGKIGRPQPRMQLRLIGPTVKSDAQLLLPAAI
jgi:hypothetical protein